MRWFWIIIALVGAATTAVLLRPTIDAPAPAAPQAPSAPPTPPAPITRLDSRTIRLDDTFDITGAGSPIDPFLINWPLLISPQVKDAPMDAVEIPASIRQLDGASVQISGYLAPPVAVDETGELLVMRNRWDGCCIGTPPTPYDCIEVTLTEKVPVRGKHLIQFGTVRGRLRVEPFMAGKFLLGLYRIEDGEVEGFGN